MNASIQFVKATAVQLRRALEGAFRTDTALPGALRELPSAGHCAAVAALVRKRLGGWLVSAIVHDESHWFNRIRVGNRILDLDLTGDQFGRADIQIAELGNLYPGTRLRRPTELQSETLQRAKLLEERAGFKRRRKGARSRTSRVRIRQATPGQY